MKYDNLIKHLVEAGRYAEAEKVITAYDEYNHFTAIWGEALKASRKVLQSANTQAVERIAKQLGQEMEKKEKDELLRHVRAQLAGLGREANKAAQSLSKQDMDELLGGVAHLYYAVAAARALK